MGFCKFHHVYTLERYCCRAFTPPPNFGNEVESAEDAAEDALNSND